MCYYTREKTPTSLGIVGCGLVSLTVLFVTPAISQSLVTGGDWSGPYWGVSGGGAFADVKHATKSTDLSWSGHVGYGLSLTSFFVGVEFDGAWGGASATSYISPLYSSTLKVNWTTTARARVGFATNGLLLYVTGCAAWSHQSLSAYSLGSEVAFGDKVIPGSVMALFRSNVALSSKPRRQPDRIAA